MANNPWRPFKTQIEALGATKETKTVKRTPKAKNRPEGLKIDPLERQIQAALIQWAQHHPIVRDFMFSIPNEGKRSRWLGHAMRASGLKAGCSDLMLAYPKGQYHGLFLELKRKGKKPTEL